jgi:ribonuclease P protein component
VGLRTRAGGLPRRDRLAGNRDFQAVFQQGERIERPSLTVLWRRHSGPLRVGFAVGRHTQGAVLRNRVRRRLREAYRASRRPEMAGADIVIIGRRGALAGPFQALVREIGSALDAIDARRPDRVA